MDVPGKGIQHGGSTSAKALRQVSGILDQHRCLQRLRLREEPKTQVRGAAWESDHWGPGKLAGVFTSAMWVFLCAWKLWKSFEERSALS